MSTVNIPVSRGKHTFTKSLFFVVAVLALILTACSGSTQATSPTPTAGTTGSVPQQSGNFPIVTSDLHISLFAAGTTAYYAPDAVDVNNGHVFIDYQNTTPKDCIDKTTSTVVEYTMDGKVVKTFSVPGHSDGMRADPTTHLLWVTSCEDGNPKFVTIDPTSGTVTPYTLPNSPHGGGFDDLYFLNGMTFIVASNPTLNSAGVNVFPAIYTITLGSGKATLKPVLMGNATINVMPLRKYRSSNPPPCGELGRVYGVTVPLVGSIVTNLGLPSSQDVTQSKWVVGSARIPSL